MTSNILLRDVTEDDLPIFFEQQLDAAANYMAAFTARDPADRDVFMAHWTKILSDDTITIKTILFERQVVGNVLSYNVLSHEERVGHTEVGYWIGKPYWGKGIATSALSAFLAHIKVRPLYARAAKDNVASSGSWKNVGSRLSARIMGFPTHAVQRSKSFF